jgi:PAB-dependent poly(A)-specific ribonuclease subunit 3
VSNHTPAPNLQQTAEASVFNPAAIREFTPQNYDIGNTVMSQAFVKQTKQNVY